MSKSSPTTFLGVIYMLICMASGAAVGVSWAAFEFSSKPQLFRSSAKIIAGSRPSLEQEVSWEEASTDFYGAIIETLTSPEMTRRAQERVMALHPDLTRSAVEIGVTQSKGSAIFSILATSGEPEYTQIFLNALLDEFIAFRKEIRDQSKSTALSKFLAETEKTQKAVSEALNVLEKARSDQGSVIAKIESERLSKRLESVSNERDDLKILLHGNPPDSDVRSNRLNSLEVEIKRLEGEVVIQEAAAASIFAATERYEAAKQVQQKLYEKGEREWKTFDLFKVGSEYVAIQERATTASEYADAWKVPVAIYGGLGALVGLIGLPIAFCVRCLLNPRAAAR